MPLPVPAPPGLAAFRGRFGADDFAEFAQVLAPRAQQGPMTLVYAPTTIVHHHTQAPAPLPTDQAGTPAHPGIDIDTTSHDGAFTPPAYVSALPPVPERRTLAPLGFLLCDWSTLAAALATAVTSGNPAAIAVTFAALTGTAASAAAIYRGQR